MLVANRYCELWQNPLPKLPDERVSPQIVDYRNEEQVLHSHLLPEVRLPYKPMSAEKAHVNRSAQPTVFNAMEGLAECHLSQYVKCDHLIPLLYI